MTSPTLSSRLAGLDKAATQGSVEYIEGESIIRAFDGSPLADTSCAGNLEDSCGEFIAALVNAYRSGLLTLKED